MPARGGVGLVVLLIVLVVVLVVDEADRGADLEPGERSGSPGIGRPAPPRGGVRGEVNRVIDGDTIEVALDAAIDGGPELEDVRYIGIDTPETVKPGAPVECFGPEASEFNHGLVEGERVRLRFDRELRDRFGRLLAYVYVGEVFVNAELISGGFARTLEIEPNTAEAAHLADLRGEAGAAGRGLWSAC